MGRPIVYAPAAVYSEKDVSKTLGLRLKGPRVWLPTELRNVRGGEIIVYYGGWDLQAIRRCRAGQQHMCQHQDWYDDQRWIAEPGYYRLLLPVHGTNERTWNDQLSQLQTMGPEWHAAPIVVAATALLVHLVATGVDVLNNSLARCAESLPSDNRAAIKVERGAVSLLRSWGDDAFGRVYLAAAQKC
jgi:hypothetical protein